MLLNAEQILAAQDRATKVVPVPEWGEGAEVLVGSMGALARAQMDDWLMSLGKSPQPPEPDEDEVVTCDTAELEPAPDAGTKTYTVTENTHVMVRWCAECILDPETHKPAFGFERIQELGGKSPAALMRIYEACLEVNLATAAAAEDLEKNSEGTLGGSSGSV